MKRVLILLAVCLLAFGCVASKRTLSLMGLWGGEFSLDSPTKTGIQPFKGFLRLFGNQKYQLHWENTAQNFDVTGTWKLEKKRITFQVVKIDYQLPSELDQQTLSLKVLPKDDIRTAFSHPFFLDLGDNDATLTGPSMDLGPLIGRQLFTKRKLDQG